MEHIAIMKKSWGLLPKILSGQKKIESRWYRARVAPWDRIKTGETVYFKNAGEPVKVKATVARVEQIADLTPGKVNTILQAYGHADGLYPSEIPAFSKRFKDKKYCILVFLKNPRRVKPFAINKKGFGAMCAWISGPRVAKIKLHD